MRHGRDYESLIEEQDNRHYVHNGDVRNSYPSQSQHPIVIEGVDEIKKSMQRTLRITCVFRIVQSLVGIGAAIASVKLGQDWFEFNDHILLMSVVSIMSVVFSMWMVIEYATLRTAFKRMPQAAKSGVTLFFDILFLCLWIATAVDLWNFTSVFMKFQTCMYRHGTWYNQIENNPWVNRLDVGYNCEAALSSIVLGIC